jgi:hypothetical protein
MTDEELHDKAGESKDWTRRRFIAATGAAVVMGSAGRSQADTETQPTDARGVQAIHFPQSFLYCSPNDSGIWVRVQVECRGRLTDAATGKTDEYVLGVVAKTGLSPDPKTGGRAPGYDYSIIFSRTHVFTKRSHTSAYFNNPTVLKHAEFGTARWRLRRVQAEPLSSPSQVRQALEGWRELSATTTFTSEDGARRYSVDYPVKWADFMLNDNGFRVETGPVLMLDPDRLKVGDVPSFDDFQWAHFDYRSLDRVRCLLERKTSIFKGATFNPPEEHGRQFRENPALSADQLSRLRSLVFSEEHAPLPPEKMESLLSTDHYSAVEETEARTELYSLIT